MTIISAKYISENTIEVEESTTKFVPDDMANADRQALAAWEAEGNEIEPLEATKPAPQARHTAPKPVQKPTVRRRR